MLGSVDDDLLGVGSGDRGLSLPSDVLGPCGDAALEGCRQLFRLVPADCRVLPGWGQPLDMRPALDTDTDAQTAAANAAIILVDVDEWAMKAVKMQVAQHRKIMTTLGRPEDDLDILGLVISRVMKPMGDFDAAVYRQLQNHPRIPLLGEIPVRSADLKEARNQGLPVVFFRPKTDTAGFFRRIASNAGLVTAA